MLYLWHGKWYKRNIFSCTYPIQPSHKHLDCKLWRQILALMINNISNRKLKYPLGRSYRDSLIHWKWYYSATTNGLYARHDQMYKDYVMINRGARRNEWNFVANPGLCHTLPEDINEVDVYYDWSYKLQSCIHESCQHIPESTKCRN